MGRQPCCDKVGLKRGPWTIEEDHKLVNFILNNGIQCWRLVPKLAGLLRCGKSCRLRWINYLRPDLKRGAFTDMEEDQIIQLHSRLGNRWSKIASHFPGRTDNEIKNHWNTRIKKKLKLLGVDPVTHKRIELLNQRSDHQDHDHDQDGRGINNGEATTTTLQSNSPKGSELEKISEIDDMMIMKKDFPGKYEKIEEGRTEMEYSPWFVDQEETNNHNNHNNNNNIINTSSNSCSNSSSISTWEECSNYNNCRLDNNNIINSNNNNNNNNDALMDDYYYYSASDSAFQQWINNVDSLLSWDCFNHLDDSLFLLGK